MKMWLMVLLAVLSLLGCASQSSQQGSAIGGFVMAGPTTTAAAELSMRWQYGLQLTVDPKSVSEVKFSCDSMPGATFTAKATELKILKNGTVYAEGPTIAVSKASTPWLFENSTSSARCRAVISRSNQADAIVTAPVNFPPSQKVAILQQFKMAHEYNSQPKK